MKRLDTEVLVIGGGATGTGILRDLAMRGFKAILVEKRDLSHGTTGRYHGLLHSGGRYVVKDPKAAKECIIENQILRQIMPFCIEDTGGFFVTTPWDEAVYCDRFVRGCREAGISIEEVPISLMLQEEPMLNPNITRCFRVPDASADSFLASEANAASARSYGAQVLTYHEVNKLILADNRVVGAVCQDLVDAETIHIYSDLTVNASGAWAGKIAASADIEVQIKPGKGTMLAVNHRIVNTVVNRCKLPADGDILVPAHTVAVIGTTDEQVADPDHFAIEPWEIQLMLDEGEKLVPEFKNLRILRAWAGVRPLYQETKLDEESLSRDISRAYTLLDHSQRDGIDGLVTITSGKWTTYRMMAEATVDKVCELLKADRSCRTHEEILPSPSDSSHPGYHWLGARLAEIEAERAYGRLVCECELATEKDIKLAIQSGARTIDDIRRETRLGMGPCQGGFCTFRAAGMMHQINHPPVETSNALLADFLQERWKGLKPVLWGQQLRQERLDELIYLNVLNLQGAPGPLKSRLGPVNYVSTKRPDLTKPVPSLAPKTDIQPYNGHPSLDVLVIGAGMAGLTAAWRAARLGLRVRCISKGWSALFWSSGCMDVLGSKPETPSKPVIALKDSLEQLILEHPNHPYAIVGLSRLEKILQDLQDVFNRSGYPLESAIADNPLAQNWLLPTALGTLRATCLAPKTMTAGDCQMKHPVLVIGFSGFADFYPEIAAANLNALGIPAESARLDISQIQNHRNLSSRNLALFFQDPTFLHTVQGAIQIALANTTLDRSHLRVGLPAVLGSEPQLDTWENLQRDLGIPVFEMPGLPPSLPGIRLHQVMVNAVERAGGKVYDGMEALDFDHERERVTRVWSEAASRRKSHLAKSFILATGGILGGGLSLSVQEQIRENVFGIPVFNNIEQQDDGWLKPDFFHAGSHPVFRTGVIVNKNLQPCKPNGKPYFENLLAAGSSLADGDFLRDHSLEGIAAASGSQASEIIYNELKRSEQ